MKIAIDPGHGMSNRKTGLYDPGAISRVNGVEYHEADIVLRFGLRLREHLHTLGHEVFMTRCSPQEHAPLEQRTQRAEQAGCSAFISIHTNAHHDPLVRGLEAYYKGDGADQVAENLLDELAISTGLHNRGIRPINLEADKTRFSGIAILLELGYLSNPEDRHLLLDDSRDDQVCSSICRVIARHNPEAPIL